MANSADPDQLASSEGLIWIYTVCKGRVYLGSAGQGLINICAYSLPGADNCLSKISQGKRMNIENTNDHSSRENVARPGGDQTHNLLITS